MKKGCEHCWHLQTTDAPKAKAGVDVWMCCQCGVTDMLPWIKRPDRMHGPFVKRETVKVYENL